MDFNVRQSLRRTATGRCLARDWRRRSWRVGKLLPVVIRILGTALCAFLFRTAQAGSPRTPLQIGSSNRCYETAQNIVDARRHASDPVDSSIAAACSALLNSLNASCDVPQRPFRIALNPSSSSVSVAKWEFVPLDAGSLAALEKLVRMASVGMPAMRAGVLAQEWPTRADQDWEVVQRAFKSAEQLNQPITLERLAVKVSDATRLQRSRETLYRLSISKALPSSAMLSKTKGDELSYQALLYGIAPRIYSESRSNGVLTAGDIVIQGEIGYFASVDKKRQISMYAMILDRGRLGSSLDGCGFRRIEPNKGE